MKFKMYAVIRKYKVLINYDDESCKINNFYLKKIVL